jgi:hypothetical protein
MFSWFSSASPDFEPGTKVSVAQGGVQVPGVVIARSYITPVSTTEVAVKTQAAPFTNKESVAHYVHAKYVVSCNTQLTVPSSAPIVLGTTVSRDITSTAPVEFLGEWDKKEVACLTVGASTVVYVVRIPIPGVTTVEDLDVRERGCVVQGLTAAEVTLRA